MFKFKIFISSVQKELETERLAIDELVTDNPVFSRYFETVLFEKIPAMAVSSKKAYLDSLKKSDIYIGILGFEYGTVGRNGLSPTEREYRLATKYKKTILFFIKGKQDEKRDKRIRKIIGEIKDEEKGFVYKRFENYRQLKKEVFESLKIFLQKQGINIEAEKMKNLYKFDNQICLRAVLQDISNEKVRGFLKKAKTERNLDIEINVSTKEALKKLDLLVDSQLSNTAVLFFAKNPQKFFLQSEVRCARFKGVDVTDSFIDMKVLRGSIDEQIDQAEKFVLNNIKKSAWTVPGKIPREEKWEYPPDAIREAITNAITHRDYQSTANVQVRIFDDRIEIWNPGGLPEGLTVKKLKGKHESKPQNPLVAKMFFMIKYIEQWGTGVNKMMRQCKREGLPEPKLEDTKSSFIVTFRKSKISFDTIKKLGLNQRQREIIEYLRKEKTITSTKYSSLFTVTDRTARNDLKELVKKRILVRRGRGKRDTYYELF
jgi:ATP-dependent DNA helicase RecG